MGKKREDEDGKMAKKRGGGGHSRSYAIAPAHNGSSSHNFFPYPACITVNDMSSNYFEYFQYFPLL